MRSGALPRHGTGVGSPSWDEAERLAALRRYGILDTPPEAAFDEITRIAALVFRAPIAVVNLIEDTRQFFKAEIGLGVRETPLDISICAHAILQEDLFVVPDTTNDPRFACNPLVTGEPHLRFYAGALLATPEGLPLGTVCVLDYAPRPDGITDEQAQILTALARSAMAQIELRRAVAEREALVRENEIYRRVIEQSSDFIGIADPDGNAVFVNEAGRRIVGLADLDEVRRTRVIDYFTPEDQAFAREVILPTQEREGRWVGEFRFRNFRTGETTPMHYNQFVVRDATGQRVGVATVSRDITDERRQRELLKVREAELARVQRISGIGGLEVDLRGGGFRNRRSPEYLRLHGLPPEAADESHEAWVQRIHPDDRERVETAFKRAVADGAREYRIEYRIIRPSDGEERWIAARAEIERDEWGRALRLVGAHLDITERKRAEEAVRGSEERLRAVLDTMPQMVWSTRPDGFHDYYNRRWYAFTGTPEGSTDGECWNGMFHPDDQERAWERWRHSLATGEPYEIEYRLRHASGTYRWVLGRALPIRDADGRIERWFGTCTDIDALKAGEAANARLAALVSSSPDAIVSFAPEDGRILTWNRGAEIMFGYTEGEAVGAPVNLIVPQAGERTREEDATGVFSRVLATGLVRLETKRRRKDGSLIDVAVTAARMTDPRGRVLGVSGVFRDITAQRQAEERQRLLVRELHHRIKNTLATVQAIAGSTMRSAVSMEEFRHSFADRLVSLGRTHTLLTDRNWGAVSLNELLRLELEPYDDGRGRVVLSGPEVGLPPEVSVPLGMAFHELTTNAGKHGALSTTGGRVEVTWTVRLAPEGQHLQIRWQERDGPPVSLPSRRGFGSQLLQRVLAAQVGGGVEINYAPAGVRVGIEAMLPHSPPP